MKPKTKNKIYAAIYTLSITLTLFISQPDKPQAATFTCTNCSTNLLQALEYVTGIEDLAYNAQQVYEAYNQTIAQVEMVRQNIEQLRGMYQSIAGLPDYLKNAVTGEMAKLSSLTRELGTASGDFGAIGHIFKELYPGKSEYENWSNEEYKAKWDEWAAKVDEASMAAFQLTAAQLEELQKSGELEDYINKLLATPEGQMQAMQAANNLAAIHIQESRRLRELMATAIQGDQVARMKAEKERQVQEENWRKMTETETIKGATGKRANKL